MIHELRQVKIIFLTQGSIFLQINKCKQLWKI